MTNLLNDKQERLLDLIKLNATGLQGVEKTIPLVFLRRICAREAIHSFRAQGKQHFKANIHALEAFGYIRVSNDLIILNSKYSK